MKILVTGVSGFLGSHLADALLAQGHTVIGVDNLSGGEMGNVPLGVIFFKGECGNLNQMKSMCDGVDIVYHCACMPHEGVSMFSPKFVTDSVFGVTMSVVAAAIDQKVKRFVYLSSMARYGGIKAPFTEDMDPKPQDPYGIAKLASERAIACLAEAHGMEYVIAVPHSIIGPRQKYDDPFRNVASIFINLMLQGKTPHIYGDGTQKRSFSFVSDVVEPLVKMGTKGGISREVINIGPDGNEITINKLYHMVGDLTGYDVEPFYDAGRLGEVKDASCSADKARRLLGYDPKVSTADGLLEMVEDIKKKGTKPFVYHLPIEITSDKVPVVWKKKMY